MVMSPRRKPDLIMVDIGGLSSVHGELETLALLRLLSSTFPTARGIVFKSRCLAGFAEVAPACEAVEWGEAEAARLHATAAAAATGGVISVPQAHARGA